MVEIIENDDDFLVLRSPATGLVYGVTFDTGREGETIRAAPLRELLRGAVVKPLAAKTASEPRKPASKAKKSGRKPQAPYKRSENALSPGERIEQVYGLIREHGPVKAGQLTALLNQTDNPPQSSTAIYTQLRKLVNEGRVIEEIRHEDNGDGRVMDIKYFKPKVAADEPEPIDTDEIDRELDAEEAAKEPQLTTTVATGTFNPS